MGTQGEYFGEVTNALAHLTAEQHTPVRDRLIPEAATAEDLPEPMARERRPRQDQESQSAWDPSSPLFVVLGGPGVVGL